MRSSSIVATLLATLLAWTTLASASPVTATTDIDLDKRLLGELFCLFGICTSIDYSTDVDNCGKKNNRCSASFTFEGGRGANCRGGVCGASCKSTFDYNWTLRRCQDVSSDSSNCGKCGQTCSTSSITGSSSTTCSAGTCKATACTSGWTLSSGICTKTIDLLTDPLNCGVPGNKCSTTVLNSVGAVCSSGACYATCKTLYDWNSVTKSCQDVSADTSNCGKKGQVCNVSGATSNKCSSGSCLALRCQSGYTLTNGACTAPIDLLIDPLNCGKLNNKCSTSVLNSDGATCSGGVCSAKCKGLSDWNASTKSCQDVSSDNFNCGKYGQTCTIVGSLSTTCGNGKCKAKTCSSGYTLVSDACFRTIDLLTDTDHCGSIGNACKSSGFSFVGGVGAVCENGKCGATCSSLYDYNWATGQCQDVSSDSTNCGRTGNTCSLLGASATECTSGSCSSTRCYAGYTLLSGTCVSRTASQRARLARDKIIAKRSLCPTGESPCPILGSAGYKQALARHQSGWSDFAALAAGAGGFECLDTARSLDSCGGCASTGEGKDCSKIAGAQGVGCDAGSCVVWRDGDSILMD